MTYIWSEMTRPQRNELVAEKVLKWTHVKITGWIDRDAWGRPPGSKSYWDGRRVPNFSEDMNAAWYIVRYTGSQEYDIAQEFMERLPTPMWYITAANICVAALRTMGIEVEW